MLDAFHTVSKFSQMKQSNQQWEEDKERRFFGVAHFLV
jgi:hypothetical protein